MVDILADFDPAEFLAEFAANGPELDVLADDDNAGTAVVPVQHDDDAAIVVATEPVVAAPLVEIRNAAGSHTPKYQTIAGKCGKGRQGTAAERGFLAYHMRMIKKTRHTAIFNDNFNEVIKHVQQFSIMKRRLVVSLNKSKEISGVSYIKSTRKGNRYKRRLPISWYLVTAFHGLALPGLRPTDQNKMRSVVAITVMGRQLTLLAKLCILLQKEKATTFVHARKFDEASHSFNVASTSKHANRSVWSVMIYRASLLLAWADGRGMQLKLAIVLFEKLWSPTCACESSCTHDLDFTYGSHIVQHSD